MAYYSSVLYILHHNYANIHIKYSLTKNNSHFSGPRRSRKMGIVNSYINISKSSSTVVIPAIPKLSTNTLTTLGDKNAGRVGPR